MITPAEATARVLALREPVAIETVPLGMAAGRWAAKDVIARRTQPARDLSSMDGYAIRAADPGPWRIVGASAAGAPSPVAIARGESVRVFTGAAVPEGSDAILVQEDAARDADTLTLIGARPAAGAFIRRRGSDFMSGVRLLAAGDPLTPAAIALAAIGGHGALDVRRRLRVALLSTGDELIPPSVEMHPDRLPDSNAPMLSAMLRTFPVELIDLGIVPDDRAALAAAFARAADCDIVVATGGASVGDHDLVRPILLELGATLDFWRVAMRPGKPLMAGTLAQAVVLGLPGNPVSAFVTATLFLLPLVRHLSGARQSLPPTVTAHCRDALPAVAARTDFVRAYWVESELVPLPSLDSAILSSLAQAGALIVRPAHAEATSRGALVEAMLLG